MEQTLKSNTGTVLIYPVRQTEHWWRQVGENMGFKKCVITADLRGVGDHCVVDDFYKNFKILMKSEQPTSEHFDEQEVSEIIARCRLLRWLPIKKATAMVHAMARSFAPVLEAEIPEVILSFPIDRYVSDVLERLGTKRSIPYIELTASLLPDMSMLMYQGKLLNFNQDINKLALKEKVTEIANPSFTPSYVQVSSKYTLKRFLKTFMYFKVRGWAFKIISLLKNDPLNLHYMDAQAFLGHKPDLKDSSITKLVDYNWREKINSFDKQKRVFLGLQLFPEASIDYWIRDLDLIEYEDILVEMVEVFTSSGYQILVKDHPLQYGFRQVELLHRLMKFPNVVIVPYDVSGNEMLDLCDINFTCTGTLGLQAALLGKKSIVVKNYYSNETDFIEFHSRQDIANLPDRVSNFNIEDDLPVRQERIIDHLMRGSFNSDFFSFEGYQKDSENPTVSELGENLGIIVKDLLKVS